ncbi:MAG: lysoplasmalogenase [Eubacteriales bacterium]|nr:lysoplasmalogenase [Eubacteriales bacterium]
MYASIAAFVIMLILGISYKKADFKKDKGTPTPKTTLLKGATTCVAGGLALYSAFTGGGTYAATISVALFLCAVADMLLEHHFMAGMGVFALGHVVYIAAFIIKNGFNEVSLLAFAGLLILLLLLYNHAEKLTDKNILPYALYGVVIMFMLSQAFFAGYLTALGALLFVASDSLIAWRIVKGNGDNQNEIACISLYYTAQFLFALSTIY